MIVDNSLNREPKSYIAIPVNATQKDEPLLIEKQKQRKELVNNNSAPIRQIARSTTIEIVNKKQSESIQEPSRQITITKNNQSQSTIPEPATIEREENRQGEITSNTEHGLFYPNRKKTKIKKRRKFNKRIFDSAWNFFKNTAKKLLNLLSSLSQNKPKNRNRK